jgi:hypothetical protein
MTISAQDHADLQQLANRYWALADLLEDVPLAELFEADATFDLGSLKLEGLAAIEAFFADRAKGMRETERTTRHVATNFLAIPQGPDEVRVRATGLVYAGNGALPLEAAAPSGIADFEDICRRQPDGRWLYHYRSGRTVFVGPNAASFAR